MVLQIQDPMTSAVTAHYVKKKILIDKKENFKEMASERNDSIKFIRDIF